nr:zinc-type alcohol dehydrogenase-like protein [Quercus suber]
MPISKRVAAAMAHFAYRAKMDFYGSYITLQPDSSLRGNVHYAESSLCPSGGSAHEAWGKTRSNARYGRDLGMFFGDKLPYIVGNNIAGVIAQLGPDVTSFAAGERVFGLSNIMASTPDQAGLQQYAILNANAIAKTPKEFSDDQVATLPVNVVTSWVALFTSLGFAWSAPFSTQTKSLDGQSQALVVIAAGSNVGKFAVQLAKLAGVGKIITVAGGANEEQLLQMGATHFFDRHLPPQEIAAKVHNLTGDKGVTHIFDCYSDDFSLARTLAIGDHPVDIRTLHPVQESEAAKFQQETPLANFKFMDDISGSLALEGGKFWQHLPDWLREGKILPTTFRVIEGLEKTDEINAALDDYAKAKAGPQSFTRAAIISIFGAVCFAIREKVLSMYCERDPSNWALENCNLSDMATNQQLLLPIWIVKWTMPARGRGRRHAAMLIPDFDYASTRPAGGVKCEGTVYQVSGSPFGGFGLNIERNWDSVRELSLESASQVGWIDQQHVRGPTDTNYPAHGSRYRTNLDRYASNVRPPGVTAHPWIAVRVHGLPPSISAL